MRIRKGNGAILRAHQLQNTTLVPLNDPEYTAAAPEPEVVAPVITTSELSVMTEGTITSQQLEATGTTPITWSVTAGWLPGDLSLSSSGLLSGIPNDHGSYDMTITATNSAGSSSVRYTGYIVPGDIGEAPMLVTTTLNQMTEGQPMSQQLVATGTQPITWAVDVGTLPAGLTLSPTGLLSGTPSSSGNYSFSITVSNEFDDYIRSYTGSIAAAEPEVVAPVITTASLNAMAKGDSTNQQLAATGTAPITWDISAGSLPAGLTLSSTGLLSGTPSVQGSYNFTVRATNSAGNNTRVYSGNIANAQLVTVVAQNLNIPWSIAFLPDDDMIVAVKTGQIRRYGNNPHTWNFETQISTEGGLMGLVLDPDYATNNFLYVYFSKPGNPVTNQVDKYTLVGNNLTFHSTLLANIPSAAIHNGGVIKFGPDGKLYICVGDANNENEAQNVHTLAGKILRINTDGTTPADNPFPGVGDGRNEIWSYGHRNPQGLAWDSSGRLWATEHGPFPGEDEINLIEKGKNYGWPVIRGNMTQAGMETPKLQSTTAVTWAPSGCEIVGNKLYFAALRGQALYAATLSGTSVVSHTRYLHETYGRIRAVTYHKGFLYVSTSNRDHAGTPRANDDHILKINIDSL